MLYHDRTDISEAIDVAKSNNSKKCLVSHYSNISAWVFFLYFVWDGCHDLTMFCPSLRHANILELVKGRLLG